MKKKLAKLEKPGAKEKLWSASAPLHPLVDAFTAGGDALLDERLLEFDCLASAAHAKTLEKAGLLSAKERGALVEALKEIVALHEKKKFSVAGFEDVHTAIEAFLVAKLGDVGKKIHAGRSRNDQVLAALRLYCRKEAKEVVGLEKKFVDALHGFKKKHGDTAIPGFTHSRKAMPSTVGAWAGAFVDSAGDNEVLLEAAAALCDQSPLGSGAGYGVPLKLDRKATAKLLGFSKVQENPVYVQNSRGKFEASLVHALSQITFDLNKLASDAMLFSMPELGFFELPPELCTGSSMMPHKRNPDVLELLRAKHAVVVACEFEIKALAANLPSGYNRDLQLTKAPLYEAFDTTKNCLRAAALVVQKLGVNEAKCAAAMTPELYSAQRALELAAAGVPFREAHAEVSKRFD